MLSSEQLKQITTEARPIIERMLDDADVLADMREVVAANGGDWSALKALIKAQVKDERDEAGDGKHVRKILEQADYSAAYAEMLGIGNLNEEIFSTDEPDHDPATGEIIDHPLPLHAADLSATTGSEPEPIVAQAGEADPGATSVQPPVRDGLSATQSPAREGVKATALHGRESSPAGAEGDVDRQPILSVAAGGSRVTHQGLVS